MLNAVIECHFVKNRKKKNHIANVSSEHVKICIKFKAFRDYHKVLKKKKKFKKFSLSTTYQKAGHIANELSPNSLYKGIIK